MNFKNIDLNFIKALSGKIVARAEENSLIAPDKLQIKLADQEREIAVMCDQEGWKVFKESIEERILELMIPLKFDNSVDVQTRCLEYEKRSAVVTELTGMLANVERTTENFEIRKSQQESEKGA